MHYKKYYESIVRPCLLSKFNHTNLNEILRFKDCTLTISFYNENAEEDIRILHALFLLELLSGQKAFVKDVSCLYRAKTKSLVFVLKVSLNDENLFNFLQMFFFIAIPNFRLRYVTRNFKIDKKSFGFFFAFKDMNVFTSLPEVYYKWDLLLNFSFQLDNITDKTSMDEVEDFYKFFYLTVDFFLQEEEDEEIDEFIVPDIDILSLSLFDTTDFLLKLEEKKKEEDI